MKRAAAFLALALAGCDMSPLPRPQTAMPARFEAPAPPAPSAAAALDRWWLLFGDAQLTSLVEAALTAAPDARSALARLREAQAVRRGALTPYDLQGNPSGSFAHSDTHISGASAEEAALLGAGKADVLSGSMNVSYELDLFGRRAAAAHAANADLDAARFDYAATRLSLAASVASQLFAARGLAAQLVEARENRRIAEGLAKIGHAREQAGIGSGTDTARLDTDYATAQSDVANLAAQLTTARRTLLVLLGRGTDPADSLPIEPVLASPPAPPDLAPGEVMQRRPDVAEAEAQLRSAAGNLRLDQLALFPKFTLQPGATITKLLGPAGYTETMWSLGAGVVMPVLDRARLLSQLGAQRARGEGAVVAYEHAVQTAYGEAANSLTTLAADRERLGHLATATERASYAFAATRKGYDAGVVALDTLLQTEQTWRGARISEVAVKAQALTDAVTCFKALGGGWTPQAPLLALPLADFPTNAKGE